MEFYIPFIKQLSQTCKQRQWIWLITTPFKRNDVLYIFPSLTPLLPLSIFCLSLSLSSSLFLLSFSVIPSVFILTFSPLIFSHTFCLFSVLFYCISRSLQSHSNTQIRTIKKISIAAETLSQPRNCFAVWLSKNNS